MRLLVLALVFLLFARTHAGSPSLVGAYDLGARAASIVLSETVDENGAPMGRLVFCRRQSLIEKHACTGAGLPVRCQLTNPREWNCDEGGDYPFHAVIRWVSDDAITYDFKSSFNSGTLRGQRLPDVVIPQN